MAKSNPLFVDSTLLHGDRIGTQIELTRAMVYEDENVVVVVTNHLGEAQHVPMKLSEEKTFVARVFLSHQKSITFRFVIEKEGKPLFHSATHQTRAQYAIIQEWEPYFDEPLPESLPRKVAAPPPPKPLTPEYTRGVASLIEKWGL
jgi:hypothetical protein